MRTIYKKVNENLKCEKLETTIVEYDKFDDIFGEFNSLIKAKTKTQLSIVDCTEEEFKIVLGSKTPNRLFVFRETFVIELDEERGKIVAKKYIVTKTSHFISKISKKILKTNKTYASLTFDIKTGGFSIFKSGVTPKGVKIKPFIRRNVITNQLLHVVTDIFDFNYTTNDEAEEGINIIAKYLGYDITVKELCGIYDSKTALNISKIDEHTPRTQAKFFVLLNHLLRTGIAINPFTMLEIGVNFRNNKKDYFGKTISHYYANELEIDDVNFIQSIVNKKDIYNTAVLTKKSVEQPIYGTLNFDPTHRSKNQMFMQLNFTALKFLYHLGYTSDQIITTHLADLVFKLTADNYYAFNDFKETKKVSVSDITKNIGILRDLANHKPFPMQRVLDLFHLQKKLEVIYGLKVDLELLIRNKELNNRIEDMLRITTNKTGIYSVSNRFLNSLKKYLPEGTKISVGKKVDGDTMSSVANVNVKHKKDMFTIYLNEDGIKWWDTQNKSTKISLFSEPAIKKVIQSELGKGLRAYELSFNRGIKPISIRANYSKKYFENLLGDVVTRNMYENIINSLVYLDK